MSETPAAPFYALRRWEGASIGVAALVSYVVFAYLLGSGRGTIASAFVCAFGLTLRACWHLRREVWFWLTMGPLAALHILAVAAFDWSGAAKWTGLTVIPFAMADLTLLFAVILLVYRWKYGAPASLFIWPEPRYAGEVD